MKYVPSAPRRIPFAGAPLILAVAALCWTATASTAEARPRCPDGTLSSGAGCCAPGAEWSEERRLCVVPTAHDRCVGGDRRACLEAGHWLLSQDAELAPLAGQLFQLACDHGVAAACSALGRLHLPHGGLDADKAKAESLFDRACRAGNLQGCADLGSLWSSDIGRSDEVTDLFAQACHRGYAPACLTYAQRAIAARQSIDEAYYYERACDAGELLACDMLATDLAKRAQARSDVLRAEDLFVLACDGGVVDACGHLASLLSCNAGSDAACRELADSGTTNRLPPLPK